eukprot:3933811-Rhodomonas_salina.7
MRTAQQTGVFSVTVGFSDYSAMTELGLRSDCGRALRCLGRSGGGEERKRGREEEEEEGGGVRGEERGRGEVEGEEGRKEG